MASNQWRKAQRRGERNARWLEMVDAQQPNPLDETEAGERVEALLSAMDDLPARQREALELTRAGMTQRQVADRMGVKETTAESLLREGRSRLRDILPAD